MASYDAASSYHYGSFSGLTAMPFSIAIWVYIPASLTGVSIRLAGCGPASGNGGIIIQKNSVDQLTAFYKGTSGAGTTNVISLPGFDQWVHVAAVWTSLSSRTIYANGSAGTGGATIAAEFTPSDFGINTTTLDAGAPTASGTGVIIDTCAVWSIALAAGDITNLYTNRYWPGTVQAASLVALWVPGAGDVTDLKGAVTLTANGTITDGSVAPVWRPWRTNRAARPMAGVRT